MIALVWRGREGVPAMAPGDMPMGQVGGAAKSKLTKGDQVAVPT